MRYYRKKQAFRKKTITTPASHLPPDPAEISPVSLLVCIYDINQCFFSPSETFQSMEAAKISCPFIIYSLILPFPTSSISRHTLKYTYMHIKHMLLFFPMGTLFTPTVNSHSLSEKWQMKWGNLGFQDTLKFSLKTVKSQEASL